MIKGLGNKGSIDVDAWVTGIIGFCISYLSWVFISPTIKELANTADNLDLPQQAQNILPLLQNVFDYAYVILAAGWLIFILYSSIRSEVEERVYQGRF